MVKILKPGFYSTVQDFGRIGYQEYGVPYSGVMDKRAASFANALLGNDKHAAVIEMTMTGGVFQFKSNTLICLSGADMNPMLNNLPIINNRIVWVKKADILSFGKLSTGFRCYLAVYGGFKTEVIMKSRSMYKGITQQSFIKKGNELVIENILASISLQHANLRVDSSYLKAPSIEVFKGPEFDLLSEAQQNKLTTYEFTISKNNNRMAYQLEESLKNDLEPIITSPVLPGTVQLTPSGKLIVLMRDCQTTGGYPRVLQLKESSIDVLAQKYTGQSIIFKLLS